MQREPLIISCGATTLTPIHRSDRERCVQLLNDPLIYRNTLRIPYPYLDGDFDRFLAIAEAKAAEHGHEVYFAIRDQHDRLIGVFGFDDLTVGHSAEIGYWLGADHRGRGVMTDVLKAACEYAQREWSLVRIVAIVFDGNVASTRVLDKTGFQFEGKMMKHCRKDGRFIDVLSYALISD